MLDTSSRGEHDIMELNEYARTLMNTTTDHTLQKWAYEAHRMIAWHTMCLVPLQADLPDTQRAGYLELVVNALDGIDERDPLVVPVVVREALLASFDGDHNKLVEARTLCTN